MSDCGLLSCAFIERGNKGRKPPQWDRIGRENSLEKAHFSEIGVVLKRYFHTSPTNAATFASKGLDGGIPPPQLLTAHTAAHTPKHGGFSGSMVTMFPVAGSSTPSTLFRQISRSPLLLRKDTVMPFLLRASTLLRIRWEKLLGVSPSVPAGSIFSNSTLAGALISGCRRSSSERRIRIRSLGCSVCSQLSDSNFQT